MDWLPTEAKVISPVLIPKGVVSGGQNYVKLQVRMKAFPEEEVESNFISALDSA